MYILVVRKAEGDIEYHTAYKVGMGNGIIVDGYAVYVQITTPELFKEEYGFEFEEDIYHWQTKNGEDEDE